MGCAVRAGARERGRDAQRIVLGKKDEAEGREFDLYINYMCMDPLYVKPKKKEPFLRFPTCLYVLLRAALLLLLCRMEYSSLHGHWGVRKA